MGLAHLSKNDNAIKELTDKGMDAELRNCRRGTAMEPGTSGMR